MRIGSIKIASHGSLDNLTLGGKVFACALLFCLHGAISLESPLVQLFAALLGMLLVTAATGFLYRPRLHVLGSVPGTVACGELLEMAVTLRHATRRAFDLLVDLQEVPSSWEVDARPARVASLRPGERAVVPLTVRATRRGVFRLPKVRVTSTFPLNLFRFSRSHDLQGEVIVTPAYRPLAQFGIVQRLGGSHAEQLTGSRTGGSEDYLGNREYLPGVPVRRWDYCSWARLGRPVVREYQNEGQVTATLLLDTFGGDARVPGEASEAFEGLLSLAASISDALARSSCRVNTLVLGPEVVSSPGLSLLDQHESILESLALARPAAEDSWEELVDELPSIVLQPGLVFVLLNGWTPRGEVLTRVLAGPGSHVCPIVLAEEKAELPPGVGRVSLAQVASGEVEIP